MKSLIMILAISCAALAHDEAIVEDPVAAYLKGIKGMTAGRSTGQFYSDDHVYKFELDLNNDGIKKVLVSASFDREGKQGHNFAVYKKVADGFEHVGEMILWPQGFYVGQVEEIGAYGAVTFYPGGGGTGSYSAFVFDGLKITENIIGSRRRDPATGEMTGPYLEDKYFGERAKAVLNSLTTIGADELEAKYGITIDPRTSVEALTEEMANRAKTPPLAPTPLPAVKPPAPLIMEPPVKPVPITPSQVAPPKQQALPQQSGSRILWLLTILATLTALYLLLRKTKG